MLSHYFEAMSSYFEKRSHYFEKVPHYFETQSLYFEKFFILTSHRICLFFFITLADMGFRIRRLGSHSVVKSSFKKTHIMVIYSTFSFAVM